MYVTRLTVKLGALTSPRTQGSRDPVERVPKTNRSPLPYTKIAKAKTNPSSAPSSWAQTTFVYFNLACGRGDRGSDWALVDRGSGIGELAASLLQSDKSLLHLITVFVFAACIGVPFHRVYSVLTKETLFTFKPFVNLLKVSLNWH